MAKEKPRCVICGQETEFFRRATLPLYNTNQIVCTDCRQRYEGSTRQEQESMKTQMLQSPYLWDRERLENLLKWKREEEQRSQNAAPATPAAATAAKGALCCAEGMEDLGRSQLPLEGSGTLTVSVCRCRKCGQVKLFAPKQP